eukprot:6581822-Ditylum_brightwellii.AAC.1
MDTDVIYDAQGRMVGFRQLSKFRVVPQQLTGRIEVGWHNELCTKACTLTKFVWQQRCRQNGNFQAMGGVKFGRNGAKPGLGSENMNNEVKVMVRVRVLGQRKEKA